MVTATPAMGKLLFWFSLRLRQLGTSGLMVGTVAVLLDKATVVFQTRWVGCSLKWSVLLARTEHGWPQCTYAQLPYFLHCYQISTGKHR